MTDNIREYGSMDEFFEEHRKTTDLANKHLSDTQRTLTWGSCWVRFWMPFESGLAGIIVIAAKVPTLDELEASERALGSDDAEIEYMRDNYARLHEDGYLFCQCFSILEPDGEWGDTHRSRAWPITQDLYDKLKAAEWEPNRLDSEALDLVARTYDTYRAAMIVMSTAMEADKG